MGITMRQTDSSDGRGHVLRGEADLADGHAVFTQVWQNVTVEPENPGDPPVVVDSVLVRAVVSLNNCLIRDPEFARQLWAEATR